MADERRRHPRVNARLPVLIYVAGRRDPISARTRDLSVGGVFVDCPEPLAVGTRALIQISFEGMGLIHARVSADQAAGQDSSAIQGESIVRWAHSDGKTSGFGVEFMNPSFEVRERITRLLEKLAQEQG